MKFTKIATMLMLCAMSMNMMADSFTASARITVTSTNGTDLVTFMEKASYSDDAMDNGADAVKLENTGDLAINIYGIVGGTNYSTVAKQHLEGTKIGFKSNNFDKTVRSIGPGILKISSLSSFNSRLKIPNNLSSILFSTSNLIASPH